MYKKLAFVILFIMSVLCSCNTNIIDDTSNNTVFSNIKVLVEGDYIGKTLSTSADEVIIGNEISDIRSNVNQSVQTFVINDGENVFLMARTPISGNSQLK